MTDSASVEQPTVAEHAQAMSRYMREGQRRAVALGNRGPLRLNNDGTIHDDILSAYWEHGFYVLEDVIEDGELGELRTDIQHLFDRAPVHRGAEVDRNGNPAFGKQYSRDTYTWIPPLSDPVGGTQRNGGRHPTKMVEPAAPADAPEEVIYMMFGMCQAMDAGLRLYGHPQLLALA